MGKPVNLACRLCNLAARRYPEQILISGETKAALNGPFTQRALGEVSVAGYESPVQVYAL
jgi:class 3 adenylate cyclase